MRVGCWWRLLQSNEASGSESELKTTESGPDHMKRAKAPRAEVVEVFLRFGFLSEPLCLPGLGSEGVLDSERSLDGPDGERTDVDLEKLFGMAPEGDGWRDEDLTGGPGMEGIRGGSGGGRSTWRS